MQSSVTIAYYFFRFDSEGQALDGVSISDLRSGGIGGSNTNWKTLYEAKSENLGQGDKVPHRSPENDRGLRFLNLSGAVWGLCSHWDPRAPITTCWQL